MITSATYQGSEQIGEATYRVRVRLVTDDERGTFETWLTVSGTTVAELRDDASRQLAAMITKQSAKNALAGIATGTAIPITAPVVAAPVPTAAETWARNVRKLERLASLGIPNGNALATRIAALRTQVVNDYESASAALRTQAEELI